MAVLLHCVFVSAGWKYLLFGIKIWSATGGWPRPAGEMEDARPQGRARIQPNTPAAHNTGWTKKNVRLLQNVVFIC